MFRLSRRIFIWKYYTAPMLRRPWLVFHFLNKLSAACALGKPLHSGGKITFFIVLIGKKTNPGLLGCINHNRKKNKSHKLGHDKRGCFSIKTLIVSSEHRFSFWYWIHTQRYICEFHLMWKVLQSDTASRLLRKPSTMFFVCQKHSLLNVFADG